MEFFNNHSSANGQMLPPSLSDKQVFKLEQATEGMILYSGYVRKDALERQAELIRELEEQSLLLRSRLALLRELVRKLEE